MTLRISNPKDLWCILLVSLILLANYTLYHTDIAKPISTGVVIGSFLDFLLFIPFTTYFLVIRKRISTKYLFVVVAACYGTAWLIIPNDIFSAFSISKYILFSVEAIFITIELYFVSKIVIKIPLIIRNFKQYNHPFFTTRMEGAIFSTIKKSRSIKIMISELSILYYSLLSWGKKKPQKLKFFTYHIKTSNIALNIMLIHAMVLESLGFHFFLHVWSPLLSYIIIFINVYGILFILAEIQAIRLNPIVFHNGKLHIQIGITKRIIIPLDKVESFGTVKQNLPNKKMIFDGTLNDFMKEQPNVEIILKEPIKSQLLYGFTKMVTTVHLKVDEPEEFYMLLKSEQF